MLAEDEFRRRPGTNNSRPRTSLVTIRDPTSAAVLAAYEKARDAGLSPAECYMAGTKVWRERHPDHTKAYAAKNAVAIILSVYSATMLNVER